MAGGILIAGASLAGLRMAECLRAAGHAGPITICGDEPHRPYNRPPLSKEALLDGADAASLQATLAFRLKPSLADVEWLCGQAVVKADLAGRTAWLADGRALRFDVLVAATGLRPRRLPIDGGESRRFVLRTVDDAVRLRRSLARGGRLAIIGGGFIGCEVASSACKLGLEVTIVEPMAHPMLRAVGPALAAAMQRVHQAAGVAFRLGEGVVSIDATDAGALRIGLTDGSVVAADLVVEAVGSECNVEWLAGNGLDLRDGLLCDDRMRVQGRPDLYAIGDVARFPNAFADPQARRIEHWCIPAMTARRAAESLVRGDAGQERLDPFMAVPSFWSDQQGLRLQSFGMPALAERVDLLEGSLAADSLRTQGAAIGYWRGERLLGVACVGLPPGKLGQYRDRVSQAAGLKAPGAA
jgi:3-phenylpropionate/trans-cinnamate dioxygenase ferredoxin reductase component